ncbi:MAG: uroporphyrinogen-III C-methyltransferase [Chloroflexota bacterium]|nr:uroporphyrinogen-III C-methyltransferase [Chloroflexota bacterium]
MIAEAPRPRGFVSLVGAGPGDPELLTLRALKRLRQAEAVVYDRLIAPELLDHCPPTAERHDVGKIPGRHGHGRQEEINSLLVSLGEAGKRVVRLKGGDPFVFGRGGEEALALAEAGVPFETVPGVSSALAAPAAAGIPVTHRGLSTSVTIATGHPRTGGPEDAGHDWAALAAMRGTLVFLMAVENLEHITGRLLDHGRPTDEPAALVRWGTTSQQTVLTASLGRIATVAREREIQPPAVLVVGPTVPLSEVLSSETVQGCEVALLGASHRAQ